MKNLPDWAWAVFAIVFGILFIIDLAAHRGKRTESRRRAFVWTLVWVTAGLAFWGFVWAISDADTAHEYLAAYLVEKSLSVDNLFLFLLVFRSLHIPGKHQRTALSWGIFGALVFRAILIFAGVRAVEHWSWLEYVFGGVLFYAAWHAFREDPAELKESRSVRWLSERMPLSTELDTSRFFVTENGAWKVTPLFTAVLAIEAADFVFAADSVTVALSITRNEFLIYSANAFAILGLRALYVFMAQTIARLKYLHYGLAAVLTFAGLKMVLGEHFDVPPIASVGVIAACMSVAAWFSLRSTARTLWELSLPETGGEAAPIKEKPRSHRSGRGRGGHFRRNAS